MAKTFFPKKSILINASCPPHPKNTQYKISIGEEDWNGNFETVVKVQMVYDNIISGRRSPSYPFGTDDFLRVEEAINSLITNDKNLKEKVLDPIIYNIGYRGEDDFNVNNKAVQLLNSLDIDFFINLNKKYQFKIFDALVSGNEDSEEIKKIFSMPSEKLNESIFKPIFNTAFEIIDSNEGEDEFKKYIRSNSGCNALIKLYVYSKDINYLIDKLYENNIYPCLLRNDLPEFEDKYSLSKEYSDKVTKILERKIKK